MIEDDHRLAEMVASYLQGQGFAVTYTETAREGLKRLAESHANNSPFSALLLDIMLPDADGLELCQRIRRQIEYPTSIPILMLTAKGDPIDRVLGLELGADDYLPKPFEPRELLARVRALVRRATQSFSAAPPTKNIINIGKLKIDLNARRVFADGIERRLTAYQFELLLALAKNAGHVLSRDQLMESVKGHNSSSFDRSIDVHIGRIRMAIEEDHKNPRRILTVRGSGYSLVKE